MIGEIIERYNASTLFLINPIVGVGKDTLNNYQLVRTYLKDRDREDLKEDLLFVLFKPNYFDNFEEFLNKQIEKNENYIEDYDYEGGYVVVVYKVPEFLIRDFRKFKEGKYSEFLTSTKKLFSKTFKSRFGKEEKTVQWRVFDRDPTLRKELEEYIGEKLPENSELFKAPGHEEILDIESIREKKLLKDKK